jgi:hypothetical protein
MLTFIKFAEPMKEVQCLFRVARTRSKSQDQRKLDLFNGDGKEKP